MRGAMNMNEHERYYLEDPRRLFDLMSKVDASKLMSPWTETEYIRRPALERRSLDGRYSMTVERKGTVVRPGLYWPITGPVRCSPEQMPPDADRARPVGWEEKDVFEGKYASGFYIAFSYSGWLPQRTIGGSMRGQSFAEAQNMLDAELRTEGFTLL